jgi:hypothetical protein
MTIVKPMLVEHRGEGLTVRILAVRVTCGEKRVLTIMSA